MTTKKANSLVIFVLMVLVLFITNTDLYSDTQSPLEKIDPTHLRQTSYKFSLFSKFFLKQYHYNPYYDVTSDYSLAPYQNQSVKRVALTFDGCETFRPAYFDEKILDYLLREQLPFTLFLSGKFIMRNWDRVQELSENPNIEIENHSLTHGIYYGKSRDWVLYDVLETDKLIEAATGKRPSYFRFPGGVYDKNAWDIVESLGYKVVHWDVASGDPDPRMTPKRIVRQVISNLKNSGVIIFHINGRGWHTAQALPIIISILRKNGYQFVLVKDYFGKE